MNVFVSLLLKAAKWCASHPDDAKKIGTTAVALVKAAKARKEPRADS